MLKVTYHTDPACPWSWALEPAVRRLMVEFGPGLDWTFVMGGLARSLPREPAARAGLIEEWLRVSDETGAPLDPLVWIDGPMDSTYPACMAVKAAAEQASDAGYRYLRRLREGIMCERRKLDRAEALVEEARRAGLDAERFRVDLRSHATTEAFAADLERTDALGAPLPALVLTAADGTRADLSGFRPPEAYREAAMRAGAQAIQQAPLAVPAALARFDRLTTREVEVLCDLPGPRAAAELWRLAEQWRVRPVRCLTGYLWEVA